MEDENPNYWPQNPTERPNNFDDSKIRTLFLTTLKVGFPSTRCWTFDLVEDYLKSKSPLDKLKKLLRLHNDESDDEDMQKCRKANPTKKTIVKLATKSVETEMPPS